MTIHVRLNAQAEDIFKQLAEACGIGPGALARALCEDLLAHAKIEGVEYKIDELLALPSMPRLSKVRRDLHLVLRGKEIEEVKKWMKYWNEPRFNYAVRRMILNFMYRTPVMDDKTIHELQNSNSQLLKIGTNINQIAHTFNVVTKRWKEQGITPNISAADLKFIEKQLDLTSRIINDYIRRARRIIMAAITNKREMPNE